MWGQVVALFRTYPHVGVLMALMILDVITGSLAAAVSGRLSSNISFRGHLRKGIILCILGTARLMEFIIPGAPLLLLGALGFCAYEVWSIVENAGRAGVPMPAKLRRAFEIFREKEEMHDARIVTQTVVDVHADHAEVNPKRDSDVVIHTKSFEANTKDRGKAD
jgi:toxin secretion/phage lysis holin